MAREHWFDRLSAPHTRRTSLKAFAVGLGGAAAATLPGAVVPQSAEAEESPQACRKGCLYVSHQVWGKGIIPCGILPALDHIFADILFHGPVAAWMVPVANLVYAPKVQRCFDEAAATAAEFEAPCMAPHCPGFNPYAGKYAPCQCAPGSYCYPCEATDVGYICCIYPPGDCHGDCCTAGNCPPGI